MANIYSSIEILYKQIHENKNLITNEFDYHKTKNSIAILKKITASLENLAKNYDAGNSIAKVSMDFKKIHANFEQNSQHHDYDLINNVQNQKIKNKLDNNYDLCYICKTRITLAQKHDFYSYMCNICGIINKSKRDAYQDLHGKFAIVTGGRVKIGFETALRLLRCGCHVLITSRFAKDALERYTKESDYDKWIHNLKIFEANFLDLDDTKKFIKFVFENYKSIDYLINNAAQTIARPKEFYNHLLLANPDVNLIKQCIINNNLAIDYQNNPIIIAPQNTQLFPLNKYDQFGQQLDLRDNNSWMLEIDDIDIKELLEVQAINNITPFIIITKLIPLLKKENNYSWIINVTSMEGIFNYNSKNTHHVHTNMAKAGLNMMTRTSGKYLYEKYNIVMCAVETGWNNPQQPLSYDFKTPIDCLDGAMRILDPIFNELKAHSVVYKDYQIHNW
jgi:NAD(P)-dependent dehydrogenase (short-subunit alcohol dehydrogenase family)